MTQNLLTGKKIYHFGNIMVHQVADGYSISNGSKVVVTDQMPCLNSNVLRVMISDDATYQRKPIAKNDVWIESTSELDRQLDIIAKIEELHNLGY